MIASTLAAALIGGLVLADGLETKLATKPGDSIVIQQRIKTALDIAAGTRSAKEAYEAIGSLSDLTKDPGDVEFFRQLFYCYVQHDDDERGELTQLLVLRIISLLDVSKTAIAHTVYPYLESEEPRLRSIAKSFLDFATETGVSDTEDFSHFRPLLDFSNPPWPLAEHMFRKSPNAAFQELLAIRERHLNMEQHRGLRLGQHLIEDAVWKQRHNYQDEFARVKNDAITQLEQFARHPEWWVRLYAAEILAKHPELRTAELLTRLREDENQLVRDATARALRKAGERRAPAPNQDPIPQPKSDPGHGQKEEMEQAEPADRLPKAAQGSRT